MCPPMFASPALRSSAYPLRRPPFRKADCDYQIVQLRRGGQERIFATYCSRPGANITEFMRQHVIQQCLRQSRKTRIDLDASDVAERRFAGLA